MLTGQALLILIQTVPGVYHNGIIRVIHEKGRGGRDFVLMQSTLDQFLNQTFDLDRQYLLVQYQ